MGKVEEAKSESGTRAVPRGRKPLGTEKLDATIARLYAVVVTKTVGNPDGMDTRNVEEYEADWTGRERAWVVDVMAELVG